MPAKCEDERLNIRLSSQIKMELKRILPKYGYRDYSEFVRTCAVRLINADKSGSYTEEKYKDVIGLDPEIRKQFFMMLSTEFREVVARHSEKKILPLYKEFTIRFYDLSGIMLLPSEAQMLIKQYYSGNFFTQDIRQAYEQVLLVEYGMDYQTKLPQHDSSHQEGEKVL